MTERTGPMGGAMFSSILPYCLYPDWLGEEMSDALLDYAEANEDRFTPSRIRQKGISAELPEIRTSLRLADLGPFAEPLRRQLLGLLPELCRRLGVGAFAPKLVEMELVAHGDGAHFLRHSDTGLGEQSARMPRRVTAVCYLHRRPRAFGGGQLRYYALDGGSFIDLDPAHGLMVSFPSFVPHSVERVSLAGGAFRDSRFAIDLWVSG